MMRTLIALALVVCTTASDHDTDVTVSTERGTTAAYVEDSSESDLGVSHTLFSP